MNLFGINDLNVRSGFILYPGWSEARNILNWRRMPQSLDVFHIQVTFHLICSSEASGGCLQCLPKQATYTDEVYDEEGKLWEYVKRKDINGTSGNVRLKK
jgi:hypothetical protein